MPTMKNVQFKQQGLSLVEMMVALTIGMIVVSGALYLSTSAMTVSRDNIRMSFLNQELRQAMNLMTSDLRRASYWGGAVDATRVSSVSTLTFSSNAAGAATLTLAYDPIDVSDGVVDSLGAQAKKAQLVYLEKDTAAPYDVKKYTATITDYDPATNAFTATLSDAFPATVLAAGGGADKGSWGIVAPVNAVTATLAEDCAIFSYDVNGNGQIDDSADTDERFGFRYDATNEAVEVRKGATACNSTGWENITDEKSVAITIFTITDQSPASITAGKFTVGIREYTIVMKGHLKSDPSIERTLRETIRVRNDKVT